MAKITTWLSTIHALLTSLPQNGYHNISRVVQPQMRSICEVLQAGSSTSSGSSVMRTKTGLDLQGMKKGSAKQMGGARGLQSGAMAVR